MKVENREMIEKLLKESKDGMSIQDLSNKTKLNRQTISVILAELRGEGLIRLIKFGMLKIHKWEEEKIN